jgi:hypothetical protein
MRRTAIITVLALTTLLGSKGALARAPGDPITLAFREGDVAGFSTIYDGDGGGPIGSIEYHQTLRGDVLSAVRIARFRDGSSDEDRAEARVGDRLVALSGRSIIRGRDGKETVDVTIDVAGGRITGSWGRDEQRQRIDEAASLPPGTYWGPLIFIVLKNFAANAEGGHVMFHTVAPTPKPRAFDLELSRVGSERVDRPGARLDTVRFDLRPSFNWLVDPVIHQMVPQTSFYVESGEPPALVRFAGPRNYAGESIRIE